MKLNSEKDRPRILYIPGPGDVFGTYGWWRKGRIDPNNPSIPYSHQVYDLAAEFGAELCVISQKELGEGENYFNFDSISFRHMEPRSWRGALYHAGQILDAMRIYRCAKSIDADIVICQKTFLHYWPLMGLSKSNIKVIISLHNTFWPISRRKRIGDFALACLNRSAFLGFDRVICVSDSVRRQVLENFGRKARPVFRQYPQYILNFRDESGVGVVGRQGIKNILYSGRVEKRKGVYSLLSAFAKLADSNPGVKLTYVGGGSCLEDLREEARKNGIEDIVDIIGPQSGERVFEIIRASDLLVCPTGGGFSEGLAKTPIEAAICGVPSLMTSAVPAADVLGDAARVVPVDDSDALFAAMKELADNPDLLSKMAAATKNCVEPFFDREKSLQAELRRALLEFGYSTV